jgi:hypothetical protein
MYTPRPPPPPPPRPPHTYYYYYFLLLLTTTTTPTTTTSSPVHRLRLLPTTHAHRLLPTASRPVQRSLPLLASRPTCAPPRPDAEPPVRRAAGVRPYLPSLLRCCCFLLGGPIVLYYISTLSPTPLVSFLSRCDPCESPVAKVLRGLCQFLTPLLLVASASQSIMAPGGGRDFNCSWEECGKVRA